MIIKILGSAKYPVITKQVCSDEAGLRSSQKVESVIEDCGGTRQGTNIATMQLQPARLPAVGQHSGLGHLFAVYSACNASASHE